MNRDEFSCCAEIMERQMMMLVAIAQELALRPRIGIIARLREDPRTTTSSRVLI